MGGVMSIQEKKDFEIAFENKLGAHCCQFDLDEDGNYEDRDTLCGWHMWLEAKAQAVQECTWSRNEDYYFDTSCGNSFMFTECEDKPSEHQFKHCCYCGGKLIEAQEQK